LALEAVRLLHRWDDPARWPASWSAPGFQTQVELIRRQLQPIHTRRSLASSFEREASRFAMAAQVRPTNIADDDGPVWLAYALRWLEVGSCRGTLRRRIQRSSR
jgi:hypothetical protein